MSLPQVRTPSNQFVDRVPEVQMERQMSDYQLKTIMAENRKLKYFTDTANIENLENQHHEVFINLSLVELTKKFVQSMIDILDDLTKMNGFDLKNIISILIRGDRLIYLGILFLIIGLSMVLI